MDKTKAHFQHLPIELKIMVITNFKRYSDLKALSLTSKEFSYLAKPYLYYIVDLRVSNAHKVDRISDFTANKKTI